MYKEEELKRLHAAGYGQVGFNYDAPEEKTPQEPEAEVEEPFEAPPELKHQLPDDMVLPESLKQHAIIEKTAKFIASQGVQMEILIKAKQGDNPQFKFLNKDSHLHPYYLALIGLVKVGKWPEKKVEIVEENPNEMNNEYLHPSLASTIIELAPSIPSIHYKPSADCDYTMLISKMRGSAGTEDAPAPGEVAPPGTEPLPPPHISRAPVIYSHPRDPTAPPQYPVPPAPTPPAPPAQLPPARSTGLSLMSHYNTDSDTDESDTEDSSSSDSKEKPKIKIVEPPDEVKVVIDKMAAYVARNGDEFAEIVRAKNDPRFTFLDPENEYHAFYKKLMQEKRGVSTNGQKNSSKNNNPPVSFSIKKLKEPDPILPKPALPYESSSDEEDNKEEKAEEPPKEVPKTNIPQVYSVNNVPPVVVYKMEGTMNNLPIVKAIEAKPQVVQKAVPMEANSSVPKIPQTIVEHALIVPPPMKPEVTKVEVKEKTPEVYRVKEKEKKDKDRSSSSREKRKHRDKKKDYRSKSESRELRRVEEKDRRREKDDRERKRKKDGKETAETEIISLVDNSDEMIDLTDELSDSKGDGASRGLGRRAAELLQRAGVDPAAAQNSSSLASAMVDTLESLRKKKDEERRRREKRRKKEKKDYGDEDRHKRSKRKYDRSSDEDGSDYDGSRRKKRKKERKHTKNKKKRREESDYEEDQPINIDLTSTLKELRNASPTKELGLQEVRKETPEEDILRRKKKKEREYSEGEWSSDSDEDSLSSASQA
ncbi:protein suppressor of white apricot isoform X2 [Aricia agestis]|nr:protein suppressor of white apricot isoform X2 [Aricia agestis]XP_041971766.1 protein suppressor of white apricot isoform X2 [Aricia agestis]XP_041971767.1 protein suppressor of white apricot isoform X2 [Aricia agestis]